VQEYISDTDDDRGKPSNDTHVRDLPEEELGTRRGLSATNLFRGEWNADGGSGRAHMLERGCRRHAQRGLELTDELPGIQGVAQVDESGRAVHH